jgi:hypothetical protein
MVRVRFAVEARNVPFIHNVQTGSEVHQETHSMGIEDRRVKLSTVLYLVPRLRTVESYLHSPTHLHGVPLNYVGNGTISPLTPKVKK